MFACWILYPPSRMHWYRTQMPLDGHCHWRSLVECRFHPSWNTPWGSAQLLSDQILFLPYTLLMAHAHQVKAVRAALFPANLHAISHIYSRNLIIGEVPYHVSLRACCLNICPLTKYISGKARRQPIKLSKLIRYTHRRETMLALYLFHFSAQGWSIQTHIPYGLQALSAVELQGTGHSQWTITSEVITFRPRHVRFSRGYWMAKTFWLR